MSKNIIGNNDIDMNDISKKEIKKMFNIVLNELTKKKITKPKKISTTIKYLKNNKSKVLKIFVEFK